MFVDRARGTPHTRSISAPLSRTVSASAYKHQQAGLDQR